MSGAREKIPTNYIYKLFITYLFRNIHLDYKKPNIGTADFRLKL